MAWFQAAWARTGIPPWNDVVRMHRGEPKPRQTPEDMLAIAKRINRFYGGELVVKKEAARG